MNSLSPLKEKRLAVWHSVARYRATLTMYMGVFFSSILGAVWVHRVTPKDLAYPWRVVDSDLSGIYSLAQTVGQSWFGLVNHSLGAPFTADFSLAFVPDDLQLEVLRILTHLTHNPFVAVNIFYLLTFGLCASTFLFLADNFKLSRWVSVPLALSYAWLPYHFTRMDAGHTFLAAYYMIPIGVVFLKRLFDYQTGSIDIFFPATMLRRVGFVIGIIAVGSSGAYYGFFFALLAATVILLVPQHNHSIRVTTKRAGLTVLVSVLFVTGPILRILLSQLRGLDTVITRSPEESVQFGGSIARLLVPWGVWLPTNLRPVVLPTAFEWTISPILGVIGVWILLIGIAISRPGLTHTISNQRSIRYFFFWALLFYTASGTSLIFAYAVDPSFRCWNRLSIVIMTFAVLALGDYLGRISKFRKPMSILLLLIAFTSQIMPLKSSGIGAEPDVVSREAFQLLQESASLIRAKIEPGCQILQLPIMALPEGGQVGQVGNGDHLWLPLILEEYRWTYGAVRGTTAGNFWTVSPPSATQIISKLISKKICAVVIDSRGGAADTQSTELLEKHSDRVKIESVSYYHVLTLDNSVPQ